MGIISDIHEDLDKGAVLMMAEYRARLQAEAVRLCGDLSSSEDLVCRTLEQAIRKIDTYREDRNLFGWMRTIMQNLHRNDGLRAVNRGTEPVDAATLERYAGEDNSTDEQILRQADHDALREAIEQLDPKYKQAVLLHYFSDFSIKEIAAILRAPMGTVSRRLQIARRILAAKLADKLGKKRPLAIVAALFLTAGALFGAWQAGVGAWLAPSDEPAADDGLSPVVKMVDFQNEKESNKMKLTPMKSMAVAATAATVSLASVQAAAALPAGFTRLDYIETTGSQWINTGYVHVPSTEVSCEIYVANIATIDSNHGCPAVFGSSQGSDDAYSMAFVIYNMWADASNPNHPRYWRDEVVDAGGGTFRFNTWLQLNCRQDGAEWHPADNPSASVAAACGGATGPGDGYGCCEMLIGSLNLNGRSGTTYSLKGLRIASFTISESGVDKRRFVPCRNAAGVAGLYDEVDGGFYPNANASGGAFIGSDESCMVSAIVGTGAQYVNTGYTLGASDDILCEALVNSDQPAGGVSLFGSVNSWSVARRTLIVKNNTLQQVYGCNSKEPSKVNNGFYDRRILITCFGRTLHWESVDGEYSDDIVASVDPVACQNPMLIFNMNTAGRGSVEPGWGKTHAAATLYRFRVIDADGAAVCNLLPYYDGAAKVYGLYDTVRNAFYPSAGSGAFEGVVNGKYQVRGRTMRVLEGNVSDVDLSDYTEIAKVGAGTMRASGMPPYGDLALKEGVFSLANGEAETVTVWGRLSLAGGTKVQVDLTESGCDTFAVQGGVELVNCSSARPCQILVNPVGSAALNPGEVRTLIPSGVPAGVDAAFKLQGVSGYVTVNDGALMMIGCEPGMATWSAADDGCLWSRTGNWQNGEPPQDGDVALFDLTDGGNTTNDLVNLALGSVVFGSGAGAFAHGGTEELAVLMSISNQSASAQSFQMPLKLGVGGSGFRIDTVGPLSIDGPLTLVGSSLVKAGAGTLTVPASVFADVEAVAVAEGGIAVADETCVTFGGALSGAGDVSVSSKAIRIGSETSFTGFSGSFASGAANLEFRLDAPKMIGAEFDTPVASVGAAKKDVLVLSATSADVLSLVGATWNAHNLILATAEVGSQLEIGSGSSVTVNGSLLMGDKAGKPKTSKLTIAPGGLLDYVGPAGGFRIGHWSGACSDTHTVEVTGGELRSPTASVTVGYDAPHAFLCLESGTIDVKGVKVRERDDYVKDIAHDERLTQRGGVLALGSDGLTTGVGRKDGGVQANLAAGTLRLTADSATTFGLLAAPFGLPGTSGAYAIVLNGRTLGWNAAVQGRSDVTVSGSGSFASTSDVQGIPEGKWTLADASSSVDLSGAAGFAGGLELAAGTKAVLSVGGAGLVEMEVFKKAEFANLAALVGYKGAYRFTANSLERLHKSDAAGPINNCYYCYRGQFFVEADATYHFAGTYDDDITFEIDGEQVLSSAGMADAWKSVAVGSRGLTAGWHDFRIFVHDDAGGQGPAASDWKAAVMALGWTTDASAEGSKAASSYVRFDGHTLRLRIAGVARNLTAAGNVKSFDSEEFASTDSSALASLKPLRTVNGEAKTLWANRNAQLLGRFLAEKSGTYEFTGRFDDRISLRVDGVKVLATTDWNVTKSGSIELAAGWHSFDIRLCDTGGDVGYSPALVVRRPGEESSVSFDEEFFDMAPALAGLSGETTLAAGAELENVAGDACPIHGALAGAGRLTGRFAFALGGVWRVAVGEKEVSECVDVSGVPNDDFVKGLRSVEIDLTDKPLRKYYPLCDAGTLTGEEAAQIAVSAEGWTATVRNGRLCLVNPAPAGFTVLIR